MGAKGDNDQSEGGENNNKPETSLNLSTLEQPSFVPYPLRKEKFESS